MKRHFVSEIGICQLNMAILKQTYRIQSRRVNHKIEFRAVVNKRARVDASVKKLLH